MSRKPRRPLDYATWASPRSLPNGESPPPLRLHDQQPPSRPRVSDPWRGRMRGPEADPPLVPSRRRLPPDPAERPAPDAGLVRGMRVTVSLLDGERRRGEMVAIDPDGIALRRGPSDPPYWIEWPEVRTLRVGTPGPRQPGQPSQVEAIRDLVTAHGGTIRASEANTILLQRYGWNSNSIRQAREKAEVVAYWDPLFMAWYWKFGPSERDEDERLHGI